MGNYATAAQVETRLGTERLTHLTTDTGATPSTAKTNEAIAIAEGEVDSHLGRQYRTPIDFTAHPELQVRLRGLTIDIARYHLANLRPPVPEDWTKAYEMAIAWLVKLVKGEVALGSTDTPVSTDSRDPIGTLTSHTRNASRTNMANL